MIALAVDVGGSHVRYGIVEDGKIRATESFSVIARDGFAPVLPKLASGIRTLLAEASIDAGAVAGIGLSFPGIVDSSAATIKWVPRFKFEDALGVDLRGWARDAFDLPLAVENDANMALLGEWRFGAGKGSNDLVQVTLGSGVGSSAVVGGVPLRGKHFQAGCLGGFDVINFDGEKRSKGYRAYVECEASTWVLPELLKADPSFSMSSLASAERLDFRTVFEHAESRGDDLAIRTIDRSTKVWAALLINLIHAYDPELVILSGGIMKSADAILPRIRREVAKLAFTYWGEVEIVAAHHINDAALLGAWHAVERIGV